MLDVIVVGGGPVGVIMGLLCARRGLSVTVIERATEVYNLPRAIVMDAEIVRVFQAVGLLDQLHEITTPLVGAEFVDTDGTRIIGVDTPFDINGPLGHLLTLCYYQPELEAFIRTAAIDAGVELRLGVEATDVRELEGGNVQARLRSDYASEEMIEARWLVAADGASSPIRKGLGISFDSLDFDQEWLVIDTELIRDGVVLPACVQQICDPTRPATFVPGHARYRRWEFQLQPGESRDDMVMPDRVWQLLSPWLTPNDARLVRSVVYRFHATVASSMRHRSMFLAGDAAHQTPPFLGQGLCAGIRDAANLSWKLDMVASGAAGEGLLDTYDSERRPHSKALVAHAADTGRLIDQLSGRTEGGTTIESAYGGGRPFPNLVDGVLAGTHFMVGHQAPQARVDDQLSDGLLGNGFALLARTAAAIPDDVRTAWQSIGSRVVLMSDAALTKMFVPEDGVMIVRPDRYVAAVASTPDELRELTTALFQRMHVAYR